MKLSAHLSRLLFISLLSLTIVATAEAEPDLYSQCQISDHVDDHGFYYVSVFKSNGDKAQSFNFKKTELAQQALKSCKKAFEKSKCVNNLFSNWFMPTCDDQIEHSAIRAIQRYWDKQGFNETAHDYMAL